jgi:RNA polymerase sigma-70 factor (ECF subfamily)
MLGTRSNNGLSTVKPYLQTELPEAGPDAARANPQGAFDLERFLSGARAGNRQSIGDLLQHYRNYLMLLATTQIGRRLQPRVSPSDIVQETMLRAHRHFAQFNGRTERELMGWLRQILVTNLARFVEQHMLAAKRDVRKEVSLEHFGSALDNSATRFQAVLSAGGETPSVDAQHREEAVVLANRLAQLPPHYREVLVLRNIQGLSFEEAATRLDRSLGATRMLWLRAIEKLRAVYHRAEQQHGE